MIVVADALILLGVGLIVLAGLGVATLPDLFSRMHAATKTTSLGLSLLLLGTAVLHGTGYTALKLLLAAVFLFATQPVAAHVLSRAAHRAGVEVWEGTRWDDLAERHEGEAEAGGRPRSPD